LLPWWIWQEAGARDDEVHTMRTTLLRKVEKMVAGYRLREIMTEVQSLDAQLLSYQAGLQPVADYRAHYRQYPPRPCREERPALMGLTREDALSAPGSLFAHWFAFTPPLLPFTAPQRTQLSLAVAGLPDSIIAADFCISLTAVK